MVSLSILQRQCESDKRQFGRDRKLDTTADVSSAGEMTVIEERKVFRP